jgi:uncharacterized protein YegL
MNMSLSPSENQLIQDLQAHVDERRAQEIVASLSQHGSLSTVVDILDELKDCSGKVSHQTLETMPDYIRRCGVTTLPAWLDLTVSFAQSTGAIALKYLRESPLILGVLEGDDARQNVLSMILELADGTSESSPNCAFEYFRKTPELLLVLPSSDLLKWGELGLELADWDFVLGIEFIKESPKIAEALHFEDVRPWIQFGMKLVTENSLGKPDYVGTLEFFRSSPSLLLDLPESSLRPSIVSMGSLLADQSPEHGLLFLAEAPQLTQAIVEPGWRTKVLQFGGLVAEKDSGAALAYLRRCPDVLRLGGTPSGMQEAFETWFRGGMEVLELSPEAACTFFSLETEKALGSIVQAINGVPLREVARSLSLFARMLCGQEIKIESLPTNLLPRVSSAAHMGSVPQAIGSETSARVQLTPDGKVLYLPSLINQFSTKDQNFRVYLVMTAHEVGHLEFGTYRVPLEALRSLGNAVTARYGIPDFEPEIGPMTLGSLFAMYQQPGVIRDLWTVIEDARVEYLLQQEYPGFSRDLQSLAQDAVNNRSFLHGMTIREMVMDSLLLLYTAESETVRTREELQPIVTRVWELAKTILCPESKVEDAIRVADEIYQVMDEMVGTLAPTSFEDDSPNASDENSDLGPGPRASEEVSSTYRPITNWSYRGQMDPDIIEGQVDPSQSLSPPNQEKSGIGEGSPSSKDQSDKPETHPAPKEMDSADQAPVSGIDPPSPVEEWLAVKGGQGLGLTGESPKDGVFLYDEWDGGMRDYRSKWCRVIERLGVEGQQDFAHATLEAHGPQVRLLRRYFETIRPTGMQKIHGQEDGDDIDLDALIQRIADRRVGSDTSERVYIRRDVRQRQVATAFLIDMSGSTGRQIESGQRRVIDVEKEGLVLLSEALEAIGDQYALYGYSGQGRQQVDFMVLKDFEETQRYQTSQRIDGVTPLQQNRDGAAIRHATMKLLKCPARHRLLFLLSDGKPLDEGYDEEYALEDTKMALREARMSGIIPFCLTVDREANDYLRRMYGEVRFMIVDNIGTLPERLPQLYSRLTSAS